MASGPMLEFSPPSGRPACAAAVPGTPPPQGLRRRLASAPRRHERRRSARHPRRARGRRAAREPTRSSRRRPPRRPKLRKLRLLLTVIAARPARDRLDRLRDDDGASRPTCRTSRPRRSSRPRATRCCIDRRGRPLGLLTEQPATASSSRYADISPFMKHAIIAIEDRALLRERRRRPARHRPRASSRTSSSGGSRQGGSTITQQFVKNALEAQDERTVFQKLREAALAYHLTRKWSKEQDPHAST